MLLQKLLCIEGDLLYTQEVPSEKISAIDLAQDGLMKLLKFTSALV